MESLRPKTKSTRKKQREHKTHRNLTHNNNTLYIECAQRALLYKSIRTDRSTDTYFNAHNWAPTLTPKYIPSRNICPMSSRFMHRSGLTDQSKSIRFSACTADPANVQLVSQQYSLTLVLQIQWISNCIPYECTFREI